MPVSIISRVTRFFNGPAGAPVVPRPRQPEAESPWLDIGFRDGLEWFRGRCFTPRLTPRYTGASPGIVEYEDWIRWEYLPYLLGGMGAPGELRADQLTAQEREAVRSATVGLKKAHDLYCRRREGA